MLLSHPFGQTGRRGRGQPGRRRRHLPADIGADPVQPDQEILPSQLC